MPREYRHIKQYENEILELKAQGLSRKEIGNRLGFTAEQIQDFTKRYNRKQRKIASGAITKPQGRPKELPPSILKSNKTAQSPAHPTKNKTDTTRKGMSACYLKFNFIYHRGVLYCQHKLGQFTLKSSVFILLLLLRFLHRSIH